jgi:hypothetical protein
MLDNIMFYELVTREVITEAEAFLPGAEEQLKLTGKMSP